MKFDKDYKICTCCWFCNTIKGTVLTQDDMVTVGPLIRHRIKSLISGLKIKF